MPVMFKIGAVDAKTVCCVSVAEYDNTLHTLFLGFPERAWNKKRRGWNVPVTTPNLTYLYNTWKPEEYEVSDNAAILLKYESLVHQVEEKRAVRRWEYLFENVASTWDPPTARKPFMHQLVATESMLGAESFGLLMEMGTGKTYCVVMELDYYACKMTATEMLRIVIVCPKGLRVNWERELNIGMAPCHNIAIELLNGDMKSIDQIMNLISDPAKIKIAIVSYDSVGPMLPQLLAFKPTYIAFDESHYVKNPQATRSKACLALANECLMKRILTGTPVSNNILDLWHQFEILRPAALGFSTYNAFKREYAHVEKSGAFEKIVGFQEDKMDKLKEDMSRLSFVVKKERCLDLPQKMYETRTIEMPIGVREIYNKMAKEFYILMDDGNEATTEFIIVQMLKLSQICSGFVSGYEMADTSAAGYDPDNPKLATRLTMIPGGDAKMNVMLDDVEDVVADGSKVIIWSRFKHDNKTTLRKLAERGIKAVTFDGSVDADAKQRAVDSFNADDSVKVFIGNAKSGGVGLTLLGSATCPCHTTFFYSNDFSYGMRAQAEDRCHRIGQVNKVLYRDYVYANSIEEYIVTVLLSKRDLSDTIKNISVIKDILLKAV